MGLGPGASSPKPHILTCPQLTCRPAASLPAPGALQAPQMHTLRAPSLGRHGGCQDYRWPEWPALGSKHTICFVQNVPEADGRVLSWGPLVAVPRGPLQPVGWSGLAVGPLQLRPLSWTILRYPEPLGGHPASVDQTAWVGRNSLLNGEADGERPSGHPEWGGAWEDGLLPHLRCRPAVAGQGVLFHHSENSGADRRQHGHSPASRFLRRKGLALPSSQSGSGAGTVLLWAGTCWPPHSLYSRLPQQQRRLVSGPQSGPRASSPFPAPDQTEAPEAWDLGRGFGPEGPGPGYPDVRCRQAPPPSGILWRWDKAVQVRQQLTHGSV